MPDIFGVSNQYFGTLEKGQNCLSIEKTIDLCNKTGLSADYILLGRTSNFVDNGAKFLSDFKEEDIKSILEIIKILMIISNNSKVHDKDWKIK